MVIGEKPVENPESNIRDFYTYVTNRDEEMQLIGITKGKFHGVVYKYGKVSIGEETEKGDLPFRFEFDILDNNLIPKEKFGEDWTNLIGDILVDIIDRQDDYGNDRENDTHTATE
mgnify:FL=1|jgi:hypothetical protein|tara:strand:- start:299 stop:643 length:345 start_codon:yes stop_codon:yes gene_type:complete